MKRPSPLLYFLISSASSSKVSSHVSGLLSFHLFQCFSFIYLLESIRDFSSRVSKMSFHLSSLFYFILEPSFFFSSIAFFRASSYWSWMELDVIFIFFGKDTLRTLGINDPIYIDNLLLLFFCHFYPNIDIIKQNEIRFIN